MGVFKFVVNWKGISDAKISLAAGANVESGYIDLDSVKKISAGLAVLFGATPEANAKLEAFASPDTGNPATVAWATMELTSAADTLVQDEMDINNAPAYLKLRITNLDPNDAISVHGFYTITRRFS